MYSEQGFNFQSLDPEAVVDAIWNVGIRVESGLTPLNSYENRVWQFRDEENQRFVVKFYRPQRWSEAQLREEHRYASQLYAADFPVAAPLLLEGDTLHNSQGFWFAIFPSLGGRQYEMDNYDHLEYTGRLLGRMHQIGRQDIFQSRPTIGLDEYIYQPIQRLQKSNLIPKTHHSELILTLEKLATVVAEYWRTDWQPLRLHGDCHSGNILWQEGPLFVDLDDARNGPAIQDLWMLISGDLREQRIQWDILLEGYREFSDLDINELSLIEPLRAMRMVYYLSWIIKRWTDPAFPRAFPWIVEQDFWSRQMGLFQEQIQKLQQPLKLMALYE